MFLSSAACRSRAVSRHSGLRQPSKKASPSSMYACTSVRWMHSAAGALAEDLATADDHQRLIARGPTRGRARRLPGGLQRRHDAAVPRRESARAAQHQVQAARQRVADGFVGLATHENGLAERERLETAQVGREPPGQLVAASDDVVLGHRDHELHAHEAHAHMLIASPSAALRAPLIALNRAGM